ncbi:Ig-like domain-containing protein [Hyalangium versicolor]|uniref:Ig-like domain-containing protein n=1 Tax=Hyalangium versicolor TaxID=2861190 RepID=UPI001CCB6066|nr:Ig-like domain-containing protein [Hyalangium versicolor]
MNRFGPMGRLSTLISLMLAGCGMSPEETLLPGSSEAAPALEQSRAPLTGDNVAAYDAHFKTPACLSTGKSCDTGTLVNGRGTRGPELNAPNTLFSSCADSNAGTYHYDESLDRVRIYTEDGSGFAPGKTVVVEATVWAYYYEVDTIHIFYATDAEAPVWKKVGSVLPSQPGAQVHTRTFKLSAGANLQAIRVAMEAYEYQDNPCSPTSSYDDRDDLVFRMGDLPPQVTLNPPEPLVSGTVTLSANASDDILLSQVLFRASGVDLGAALAPPYELFWDTTHSPDGTYSLTAVAIDHKGQQTVSTPFSVIVDNNAPSVAFTAPVTGTVLTGNATLQASAEDIGGVERVEFYSDSTLLGSVAQPPYQLSWDTTSTANGSYSLQARAYDKLGHVSTSSVTVTVQNIALPTSTITSPAPNAVLSGTANFSVDAQASLGVARVTFYVGSTYVIYDNKAPYSINFNTLNFANGDYVLTARVIDTAGNVTVTEGVPVRIQN